MEKKKNRNVPVSIAEEIVLTVLGLCFPFLFIAHSSFNLEIKSMLFFLLLTVFVGIIAHIFYLRKRKNFAGELLLFYGGLNLFLALAAYYTCFVRLIFFPEISILAKPLEVVLVYCSPLVGLYVLIVSLRSEGNN